MELLAGILIIIFIIGTIGYFKLKKMIHKWARLFFGTDSLVQGLKQQQERIADTPKSVSSMTTIYLPLIMKDFPQFNLFEFSQKAENMIKSVFNAIENQRLELVVNGSDDLLHQVSAYIQDLKSQGIIERYDDIKIHKTAINSYQKEAGTCVVVFQMALEYYKYRLENNKVVAGRKDLKVQTKYNVNLVYIQDINKVKERGGKEVLGVNCPNCGASITHLGRKSCEYCGTEIQEINIHTWFLNKYQEI